MEGVVTGNGRHDHFCDNPSNRFSFTLQHLLVNVELQINNKFYCVTRRRHKHQTTKLTHLCTIIIIMRL